MRKDLYHVLAYFGYFDYAPSFEEIYTFFPKKITRKQLLDYLQQECKRKKLVRLPKNKVFGPSEQSIFNFNLRFKFPRYTLPQYSISRQSLVAGRQRKYIDMRVQVYLFILRIIPLVRFVGITGRSAVEGLRMNDDIDLFIIAKGGFIWTTRFIVVILAKLIGIRGRNGVCLNLFFDESDLTITKMKQNSYIAHEILQVRPIVDKQNIYHALIGANRWIFNYFPNASQPKAKGLKLKVRKVNKVLHATYNFLDSFFKSIQLPIIQKNKTGFRITDHQLWLFKSDFEAQLKQRGYGKVI
jgi:hypothetical protein